MDQQWTIYKYEIPMTPGQHTIETAPVERFLDVQIQDGVMVIWAVTTPASHIAERHTFGVYFTGWDIGEDDSDFSDHKGTLQDANGLVYHVFKRSWVDEKHN